MMRTEKRVSRVMSRGRLVEEEVAGEDDEEEERVEVDRDGEMACREECSCAE